MSEALNFTKLAEAPVLEEVPDGAKVYAEVDGKVYRVAGDNLGGGGGGTPMAVIYYDDDGSEYVCDSMTYEEARACLEEKKPILFMMHYGTSVECIEKVYLNEANIKIPISSIQTLYWSSGGFESVVLVG